MAEKEVKKTDILASFALEERKEVKRNANDILAEIALEERAEKIEQKQERQRHYKDALAKRKMSDATKLATRERIFQICDHLQGNHPFGKKPFKEVPNLSLHSFQDMVRRIRCNKCGFLWHPGDTAEFYFVWKDGKRTSEKRPNPTKMSWKNAYDLVNQYSDMGNKPSQAFQTIKLPNEEVLA